MKDKEQQTVLEDFYSKTHNCNAYQQSFPTKEKQYKLNKLTKELEDDGEIDINELVNSYYTTTFDYALDKYLQSGHVNLTVGGSNVQFTDEVVDCTDNNKDMLDIMNDDSQLLQDIINEYSLSENTTFKDALEFLNGKLQGGENNETKKTSVEETIEENISQNGSESTQA